MVDVNPLAEAEGLYHGGVPVPTTVKVKAMDGAPADGPPKGDGKGKMLEKTGKGPVCKFFGTDDGCKKGADCTYVHDWSLLDRKGPPRCWNCSSTKHSKRDCTVKALSSSGGSSGDQGGKGRKGGEKGKSDSTPSLKKSERSGEADKSKETVEDSQKTSSTTTTNGEQPVAVAQPAKELMMEAASLLKSLRLPSVKSMRISSLEVKSGGRALFLMEERPML